MAKHAFKRESHGKYFFDGGHSIDSYIIPTCSCGWRGTAEYATSNSQYTNLYQQEMSHLRDAYLRGHAEDEDDD